MLSSTTSASAAMVSAVPKLSPWPACTSRPSRRASFAASAMRSHCACASPVVEIHTGAWCDALAGQRTGEAQAHWLRITDAARLARREGLEVHAGHGLNFETAETIAALAEVVELNIGHFLIGEAIYDGLSGAVKRMRAAMDRGRT